MAFAGYSTITDARYPLTHSLFQRHDQPLPPPEALFPGQDFADLHHALLKPDAATSLQYNCSSVRNGYLLIVRGGEYTGSTMDGGSTFAAVTSRGRGLAGRSGLLRL